MLPNLIEVCPVSKKVFEHRSSPESPAMQTYPACDIGLALPTWAGTPTFLRLIVYDRETFTRK
ncbi:hypothetical protein WG66_006845 [Moniliophthora roreri]|nr:hypothetical protein WG66_006845 [Moniliophthora roreri]